MKKNNKFKLLFSLFIMFFSLVQSATAQKVEGQISDAQTGEPLIGASIMIKSTSKGTVTDTEGRYSIAAKEGDVLVFSFVGYVKKEVTVGTSATIDIALTTSANLDAVTVVGSRGKPRKSLRRGHSLGKTRKFATP